MKKISILGLCLLAAATASAQKDLVKSVERDMKANAAAYPDNLKKLTPAFTDAETATDAQTWFVAGKGAFDYFDNQQVMLQMGKDIDKKQLGHALIDGYGYLLKALPLDSVADAKGKIKTKYSKDVYKLINAHYNDFHNNAALYLWDAQDYPGAVEAWKIYVEAPNNPSLVKNGLKVAPDSIYAEILFNMGIGYSLAQDNENALKSFTAAIDKGYDKKQAYDYAISTASTLQRNEDIANIAKRAYEVYDDPVYIGYMVNDLVDKKQYVEAEQLIDKYIAADPNIAQLYFVKGVLLQTEEKPAEALEFFKKAVELDPNHVQALFSVGYLIYQDALAIDQNEGGGLSNAEYNDLRKNKVDPLLKEATVPLEKVLELDDTHTDARNVLRSIYYNLKDETNLKRIEAM